jgi:hypothetical protein
MDPRQEATDRVGGRYDVRVLEPSPPAPRRPPFVDDPVARGERDGGIPVVSPVSTGDVLWDDLAREDRDLATWCAERWLGAYWRLRKPPPDFGATRDALHRLAEHVISPTRQRANGEITLRWTRGGFGTPFFGDDVQLRVDGDIFIVQQAGEETLGRLTSLKDAAEYVGYDLTRFDVAMADEPLGVDPEAAHWLGDLYGFAFSVLEQLRAEAAPELQGSFVNLWPEQFDVAVELGSEASGVRAAYGVSPGDAQHAEPYVYVAPWTARPEGELWQAEGFRGAELALGELLDAADQREAALTFLRERLEALTAGAVS